MGSLLLVLLSSLFIHSAVAANSSSSSSRCIESEWRALMDFKGSLVNDASKLSSWTGRDCCSNWLGITCHNSTGHVQVLDLDGYTDKYSFNFSSPLSPWLFNLSRLEFLTIFDSGLQGPIPNMFEKLTSLVHLDLSLNSFDSPFPDSLCSLTSLTELDIGSSKLKGPLPPCLGNMTSLRMIRLGFNDLSGKIPSELGYLTNLIELVLSGNSLNSSIPSTLGNLSSLEYLALGNNQLSGKIPLILGNLTKLTELWLYNNSLMGELSESFFEGLDSLEILSMSKNKRIVLNLSSQWIPPFQMTWIYMGSAFVGQDFPPWLQTQRNVEVLDMSDANIYGDIPEWCQTAFPNLTVIDLSNNFFTGSLPTFDSSLSLRYLQLSGNQFSGNIPQELCNLKSLYTLSLGNNQLTGTIPSCLGSLHNLLQLDLGDNNLYGHIPNELGSLQYLWYLHLNGNKLTGKFPKSLQNLTALKILDLGENQLQGSIPQWIGIRWRLLLYLRLESNNLSGDIPVNLCQLPNLQILNLALNNFVGTIPSCLGNSSMMSESSNDDFEYFPRNLILRSIALMWVMATASKSSYALLYNIKGREILYTWEVLQFAKSLLLSGNHLHGEIPVELMNLKGLQSLNLSNNELTGTIPETINNLTNLESLDLSANQLSGNIPQTLAKIDALSYLNLSFNNLEGRIPSGNHFDTLHDSSFYQGNKDLCGDQPLMKSCPGDHSPISNEPSGAHVSDGDDEFDRWLPWAYAGVGPGFAVGFLGVICTLFFKDPWRIAFFGFTDDVYDKVWATFAIKISQCRSSFN